MLLTFDTTEKETMSLTSTHEQQQQQQLISDRFVTTCNPFLRATE